MGSGEGFLRGRKMREIAKWAYRQVDKNAKKGGKGNSDVSLLSGTGSADGLLWVHKIPFVFTNVESGLVFWTGARLYRGTIPKWGFWHIMGGA
jgi:hypothetical protein